MKTTSENIIEMIHNRQKESRPFDYLKSIQDDIRSSCDEIIQLVSGRRYSEDETAEPFQPLTEEQQKLSIITMVADIIEQVTVYMPRHLQNKEPIKSDKIKTLIRDLENKQTHNE